jgi:hypothetical protein
MSNGILQIQGERVVDGKGNPVILRGAGLGGWMKYAQLNRTPAQNTVHLLTDLQYGKLHVTSLELET